MSPAAMSWNPKWGARLTRAVKAAEAPIFLLQARNDYNLGPTETLGPVVEAKGRPNRSKVFPVHGDPDDHTQGHGQFFKDFDAWKDDVLPFLKDCGAL
jgi:hypothetical protein